MVMLICILDTECDVYLGVEALLFSIRIVAARIEAHSVDPGFQPSLRKEIRYSTILVCSTT